MIPKPQTQKLPRWAPVSTQPARQTLRYSQIELSKSNVTCDLETVNTGPGNAYAKGPQIPESRAAAESSKNWLHTSAKLCQPGISSRSAQFGNFDAVCYLKCRNQLRLSQPGRAVDSTLGEEPEIERAYPRTHPLEDRSRRRASPRQGGEVWRCLGV